MNRDNPIIDWLFEDIDFSRFNNKKVLDAGCCHGIQAVVLSQIYEMKMYGLDLRKKWIQEGRSMRSAYLSQGTIGNKVNFVCGNITNMPFPDGCLDFVYSTGVFPLFSFDTSKKGLEEVYRVLKRDGLGLIHLESWGKGVGHGRNLAPMMCGFLNDLPEFSDAEYQEKTWESNKGLPIHQSKIAFYKK